MHDDDDTDELIEVSYDRAARRKFQSLKRDIDEFLFVRLPDDVRLVEFELMSSQVHALICEAWRRYHPDMDLS